MSCTEIDYAALVLCLGYAMSGTDTDYTATRRLTDDRAKRGQRALGTLYCPTHTLRNPQY
eukprot:1495411-Rhodomonas_salina.1